MKLTAAGRAIVRRFLSDGVIADAEPWTGPVERLSELSPERRVALGLEPVERRRSQINIRLCQNPYCRHWTPARLSRCVVCHTLEGSNIHRP